MLHQMFVQVVVVALGLLLINLAHRNSSDFCDLRLRCPSRTPEIARFPRQDTAMLHCDLKVRWKVASDLRFWAAISEPKTPSFCGISGDLAHSTRKSLAIAIVRFWCAKLIKTLKSTLVGALVKALVGALVGGLLGPLAGPLLSPISLSTPLCVPLFFSFSLGKEGPEARKHVQLTGFGLETCPHYVLELPNPQKLAEMNL